MIDGDIEEGSLLAGQISGLIKEIEPVRVIIEEMVSEAGTMIAKLGGLCRRD